MFDIGSPLGPQRSGSKPVRRPYQNGETVALQACIIPARGLSAQILLTGHTDWTHKRTVRQQIDCSDRVKYHGPPTE